MAFWILPELIHSLLCRRKLPSRNLLLLGEPMRNNGRGSAMEEVEHAEVDTIELHT